MNTALPTRLPTRLAGALLATCLSVALVGCGTEEADPGTAEPTQSAESQSTQESESPAAVLTVQDPWVRATTGTEDPSMSAAFMTLTNDGETDLTVTGASSPVAGMVQLHEMAMVDGEMVMREVEGGIVLKPGVGQLLQPGGMHVMLMGLTDDLAPGDEVEFTLQLSDGSEVEVTAPVKEFTEEEGHYHSPGTDEDHSHE